jgi:hypothetical protein
MPYAYKTACVKQDRKKIEKEKKRKKEKRKDITANMKNTATRRE